MIHFNAKAAAFTAFVMLALSSCTADRFDIPRAESSISEVVFHARMGALTKTQIGENPESGHYLDIKWTPGDMIGVFGSDGTENECFTCIDKIASQEGCFSGILSAEETPALAYYPYNAEAGSSSEVPFSISSYQVYEGPESIEDNDIKVASGAIQNEDESYCFEFQSLCSILKIDLDLSKLSGISSDEILRSIFISNAADRPLTGSFTADISDSSPALVAGPDCSSDITLVLDARAVAGGGASTAYACIAPTVKKGDKLAFCVETDAHLVSFEMTASQDFKAGTYYDFALDVSRASAERNKLKISARTDNLPKFKTFEFTVSANPGSILSKELYYDSSNSAKVTKGRTGITTQKLTVDSDGNASGCIPYLFDFTLVPSFTLSSSKGNYVVEAGGQAVTSGVSTVDFPGGNTRFTIIDSSTHCSKDYTVDLSNTGLPVVVLEQNTAANVGKFNYFLDSYIPDKSQEWGTEDRITVYGADGSIDLATASCGFRLRGNYSSQFRKKPMNVKLETKAKILGMPKGKRWCLLANFNDRTLMRNEVTMEIARRIAATTTDTIGLGWQPHGKFVEVVLNGRHIGNYWLCEQIKIDNKRIDINDEYADVVDPSFRKCGYLLEFDTNIQYTDYGTEEWMFHTDKCQSNINYSYNGYKKSLPVISHNDYDNTAVGQRIWQELKDSVNFLDNAIYNKQYSIASKSLDMVSVADYLIVMELTMNHEHMHPKSCYMFKNGGGKFRFGPMWDFDLWTYVNVNNINSMGGLSESYPNSFNKFTFETETTGYYYFWYRYLLKCQDFVDLVKSRWNTLYSSGIISTASVNAIIDACYGQIRTSAQYNSTMWPLISGSKQNTGYMNGDEWHKSGSNYVSYSFDEAVALLKSTYAARLDGLNSAFARLSTSTMNR